MSGQDDTLHNIVLVKVYAVSDQDKLLCNMLSNIALVKCVVPDQYNMKLQSDLIHFPKQIHQ